MFTAVRARGRIIAGAAIAVLLGAGLAAATPVESADALSGSDFNAGNIISDALFYDAAAMTQADIQAFLNEKIGACQNGQCLNVLVSSVASRPRTVSSRTGALICEAFEGGTLTAAAIIYRTQVACSISAKVILTTLQKEQGLVTKTAPSQSALDRAMGMACPDTAPCDEEYLGFGNQVYEGSAQLMIYKASKFGKQPGVNTIGYNPSASCGSVSVNVQNYATAALYNYTPYVPNAAALANLGGTGDGCSSYGNRNFWYYYTNWFGSTQGLPPGSIDQGSSVIARDAAGLLWLYPGNGKGSWLARVQIGQGWGSFTSIVGTGDFDGDGHRDVLAVDTAGSMWLFPSDGKASFGTAVKVADGWGAMTAIFSPGDFSGDKKQDILARDASGLLWLYAGNGRGGVAPAVQVGTGWNVMDSILPGGDFNGDGKTDVIARDTTGALYMYMGNGKGGWLGATKIGSGWSGFNSITSAGDFNGDGTTDVIARDTAGSLYLYPGNGKGSWLAAVKIGSGWDSMTALTGTGDAAGAPYKDQPGVGDLDLDGARDVIARDTTGTLWLYPGNGKSSWKTPSKISTSGWANQLTAFGVNDFNGDGVQDVVSVDSAGLMWLYSANGSGGLTAGTQIGAGWEVMTKIFSPGDFDGDKKQDIVAVDSAGRMFLYPGDGLGGFLNSRQIGTGWDVMTAMFAAGDFNGDGFQDVLASTANGSLFLYPGNGSGSWLAPSQIGQGWDVMDNLFSPGDFSGDGAPDVLARDSTGKLWLYPGSGTGTWLAPVRVGTGWDVMDFIS